MTVFVRVFFTAWSFFISAFMTMAQGNHAAPGHKSSIYVCSPCGQDCDKKTYDKPGECPVCHMPLVKKSSITFKSIDPSGISAYLKSHPKTVLLDVRTKEEFEGKANPDFGTLKNAINIPVQELGNRLAELDTLKKTNIIVYCSHAHRSAQASFLLTQNGFHHVLNMSGGVSTMTDSSYKNIFR